MTQNALYLLIPCSKYPIDSPHGHQQDHSFSNVAIPLLTDVILQAVHLTKFEVTFCLQNKS